MGELKSSPAMPIAASALSFGATHLALRHGPVHRRLTAMYARRKEAGRLQPNSDPPQLASQAGSRILNEIHNIMVVRIAACWLCFTGSRVAASVLVPQPRWALCQWRISWTCGILDIAIVYANSTNSVACMFTVWASPRSVLQPNCRC